MKTVLFSVSYAGFWGQAKLSLEEFIPLAASLGYDAVELMAKRPHLSPLDYTAERAASLRELCGRNRISVACVAGYTNFTGGAESAEVPFAEMQIAYVESLCRLARALECPLVRVFTSYDRPDMPPAEQWRRTVTPIRECCDRAAALGVTIGIQNHHDVAVHSKALMELLNDIDRPNCRLMFDPWSPALRGEELFETAKTLARHVAYTTLADYVSLPQFRYRPELINYEPLPVNMARAVPMGQGEIDSLTFLKGLKAGGYDGPVAYEMCSPLRGGGGRENLDRCAKAFLEWVRRSGL
jgi:sugar phosphate isomerase/epimerase